VLTLMLPRVLERRRDMLREDQQPA
jgi:hypothetical protein